MKNTSGNALWLILIAIFLLGGLTVLVTRTGSQTEDTGSVEKTSLQATNILKYAGNMKNSVNALFARGCSEEEISFENSIDSSYVNPKSPSDKSCHVFEPQGGGLTFQKFSPNYFDTVNTFQGSPIFWNGLGIKNAGTTNADLIFYFNNVSKTVCMAINKQLGITNPSGDAPAESRSTTAGASNFKGDYVGVSTDPIGDAPELLNKKWGCYYQTNGSMYQFYMLLVPR